MSIFKDIKNLKKDVIEGHVLFNESWESVLPQIMDKSIDLVLVDPPYELDNHGGGQTELAQRKLVKDLHIDFISSSFDIDKVFNEFLRMSKIPNFLIFCSNKQVSKIMSFFENKKLSTTLLVWNKTNPSPLCNGKHLSDIEFVVYVRGKGVTFNNDTPFDYKRKVYTSPIVSNKNRLHPTEKPIELLKQYILLHSNEGDIVLNCFMGNNTTGKACKDLGRKYVGIEIDKDYYETSKNRYND